MWRGLVDVLDQLVRELEHLDQRRQMVAGRDLAVVDRHVPNDEGAPQASVVTTTAAGTVCKLDQPR